MNPPLRTSPFQGNPDDKAEKDRLKQKEEQDKLDKASREKEKRAKKNLA